MMTTIILTKRCWLIAILIVVISMLVLELTLGGKLEKRSIEKIAASGEASWAEKRYSTEKNQLPIKPKETKFRILYLSNSHAFTGGYVSRHLQSLLNSVFPGEYEIVNLSSAGMFAPEFLQRFIAATNYDIDMVIIPIAYISLSDRMKLANQAFTSKSFFKPDVFSMLPLTFWWRNYDVGLFCNTLVEHKVKLFKYRNDLRNTWEIPLVTKLYGSGLRGPFCFLEVDENQSWRFPDGFDRNLFDWKLYSLGRKNHLAELADLMSIASSEKIDVIASNLPIDFTKDPHAVKEEDFKQYQKQIAYIFRSADSFIDFQNFFPKEFSTYDALHPTWYGARLHALYFALQLNKMRDESLQETEIYDAFINSEPAVSEEYIQLLNGQFNGKSINSFRRYDIFEPENAKDLLTRVSSSTVGGIMDNNLLYELSLRLRYWQEYKFSINSPEGIDDSSKLWENTVREEVKKCAKRADYFQKKLVELEKARLGKYPIPTVDKSTLISSQKRKTTYNGEIIKNKYQYNKYILINHYIDNKTKKMFAVSVLKNDGTLLYNRTDILGDETFIQLSFAPQLFIPQWIIYDTPTSKFGI